jgi:hypothetical protein
VVTGQPQWTAAAAPGPTAAVVTGGQPWTGTCGGDQRAAADQGMAEGQGAPDLQGCLGREDGCQRPEAVWGRSEVTVVWRRHIWWWERVWGQGRGA